MTKRLHTKVKIPFANPYVVRLDHDEPMGAINPMAFTKLTRQVYKVIQGTWGFCNPEFELVKVKNEFSHTVPPGHGHFNGMNQNQILSAIFDPDYKHIFRSYWCFKDELDALQFRLMIGEKALKVEMWPERWFTIHEVVETDES